MSDAGAVRLSIDGALASIVFDRPAARNAMTWAMYEQLGDVCDRLRADASLRVATLRGAGGRAFVAGTDIAQFAAFGGGDDGLAYERRIDAAMDALATLPMPTIALVEGHAVGGGLAIATACDFRIATPDARFGVPIARTVGNCLSMANVSLLVAEFGTPRVRRMLLAAELIGAHEACACGYVHRVCDAAGLDNAARALAAALAALGPVTQQVSKQALRRLALAGLPDGDDLIRRAYASADFREGVTAFLERRPPRWRGC